MKQNARRDPVAVAAWITAFAALLVALVAVWQGWETRLANRLAVVPHLVFTTNFAKPLPGSDFFGIRLENRGLGPAVVTEFRLFVDAEPVESDAKREWRATLNLLGVNEPWVRYYKMNPGTYLEKGAPVILVSIMDDQVRPETMRSFREATSRLGIAICYCSVYEKCKVARYGTALDAGRLKRRCR